MALVLVVAGTSGAFGPRTPPQTDCTLHGKKLYGRVQVVEAFADLDVQVVSAFPDLKVQVVEAFPDGCGKWQFVDAFPDLKIRYVEAFPDLRIQFVSSFPGVPHSGLATSHIGPSLPGSTPSRAAFAGHADFRIP